MRTQEMQQQRKETNSLFKAGLLLGGLFTVIVYAMWALFDNTIEYRSLKWLLMIACCVFVFIKTRKQTPTLKPIINSTYVDEIIAVIYISYTAATVVAIAAWLPIVMIDPTYFDVQLIVTQAQLSLENSVAAKVWLIIKQSYVGPVLSEIIDIAALGLITGLFTALYTRKKYVKA